MITAPCTPPPVFYGLSTDTKPTRISCNGAKFVEIDTHAEFYYDQENDLWYGAPEPEDADDA